jgi:hypothetical protein
MVVGFTTISANQYLSPLTFFFWVLPGSYTNKTDRHDINEILLKVAINTISLTLKSIFYLFFLFIAYSILLNLQISINCKLNNKHNQKRTNIEKKTRDKIVFLETE